MTQEDKDLLLKDLCARLPYGLKGTVEIEVSTEEYSIESGHLLFMDKEIDVELLGINKETEEIEAYPLNNNIDLDGYDYTIDDFIPYFRPMSSMTKDKFEDLKEYSGLKYEQLDLASYQEGAHKCLDFYLNEIPSYVVILVFDWLNKHHFDYRGLIEMGLAIKAPEGMYNNI